MHTIHLHCTVVNTLAEGLQSIGFRAILLKLLKNGRSNDLGMFPKNTKGGPVGPPFVFFFGFFNVGYAKYRIISRILSR